MTAIVRTSMLVSATGRTSEDSSLQEVVRRWGRLFLIVVIFLFGVGGYYVGIKGEGRSAVNRWRPQVQSLWQGEDIYLKYGFPTPPIMAIVLTPFCLLPGPLAMSSWFLAKSVMTLMVLAWLLQVVEQRGVRLPGWAAGAALLLAVRPVMGDLLHGNVNLWILFLVMAAVVSFREHRDVLAGGALSLAIACKLTPALLLVYFVWKRAWKLAAATVVGLAFWLLFVPALFLGAGRNVDLLKHWADYMVWPYVHSGEVETLQTNQSAAALLYRLFVDEDSDDESAVDAVKLMAARPLIVRRIWTVIAAGLIGGLAFACRTRWPDRRSIGWLLEIGLVLLVMLLISERSWKHHFVWLLPIGITLAAVASEFGQQRSLKWVSTAIMTLMGLAFLLMTATSQDIVRPIAGEQGAKLVQACGAYVWASLAIGTAIIMSLRYYRLMLPISSRS